MTKAQEIDQLITASPFHFGLLITTTNGSVLAMANEINNMDAANPNLSAAECLEAWTTATIAGLS